MNRIGLGLKIMLLLSTLILPQCTASNRAKCSAANGNREACEAMSSDCTTVGQSQCAGVKCSANYCQINQAAKTCEISPESAKIFPRDRRLFSEGKVSEKLPSYSYIYKNLSEGAKALAGKKISREDLKKITQNDGRVFCGAFPSDVIELNWDESKSQAICDIGPDPCSRCKFYYQDVTCVAKNKCNDVICL